MKAHYLTDEGDIRIIRPLVYIRERHTRIFAHHVRLPIIPENCPACFSGPTIRYKIKRLLSAEEATNPNLFHCLLQAIHPLMLSEGEAAMRDIGKVDAMIPVIPTKEPPHLQYYKLQLSHTNVNIKKNDDDEEKKDSNVITDDDANITTIATNCGDLFGSNDIDFE